MVHVETDNSDSSVCVSHRENDDDFIEPCVSHESHDQDELANSELLYVLPDDEALNNPVSTCSHIEHDSVEADVESFYLLKEEDYRDCMDQVSYCREYDSESSVSDSEEDAQNVNSYGSRKPVYSGTSIGKISV